MSCHEKPQSPKCFPAVNLKRFQCVQLKGFTSISRMQQLLATPLQLQNNMYSAMSSVVQKTLFQLAKLLEANFFS